MDAMTEEHVNTGLQVTVELPPVHHEAGTMVQQIIMGMFEEDDYDVDLTIVRTDKLGVVVHVPMKSNHPDETALLKQDNIAAALIMQRLMMTL
jgi:hypothetical protein